MAYNSTMISRSLKSVIILSVILLLVGCEVQEVTQHDYFPLRVGNEYHYYNPSDTTYKSFSKVWEQVSFEGEVYYAMGRDSLRVGYYRKEPGTGNVIQYDQYYDIENLRYRFNVAEGDTYHVYSNLSDLSEFQIVTVVSRRETVETTAGTFRNCIYLAFDTPEWRDDEIYYWFAPEVGIVKYYGAWQPLRMLARAKVSGDTYP